MKISSQLEDISERKQSKTHTAVIFACNEGGIGAFPPLFERRPLKILRGAPPEEGGGRGADLCEDKGTGAR